MKTKTKPATGGTAPIKSIPTAKHLHELELPKSVKLNKKQSVFVGRIARLEGVSTEAMLRAIFLREETRIREQQRRDGEIMAFLQALRRCGVEPDNFEDDRELWKSKGGPVVRFRMPRAAGFNGLTNGYRVRDVRRALARWHEEQIAAMANQAEGGES